MVEKEVVRTVKMWRERGDEERGGKREEACRRSLAQVARLPNHSLLKDAWKRTEGGGNRRESKSWAKR